MRSIILAVALVLAPAAPAYAGHGYGYEDECRGGGCGNEREENYDQTGCKYVCPAFDRSPVQDSFNPTICVMPGSCTERGQEGEPSGPQ